MTEENINLLYGYAIVLNQYIDTLQIDFINKYCKKDKEYIFQIIKMDINEEECINEIRKKAEILKGYSKRKYIKERKKYFRFLCLDGNFSEKDIEFMKIVFEIKPDEQEKLRKKHIKKVISKRKRVVSRSVLKQIVYETETQKKQMIHIINKCNEIIYKLKEDNDVLELKIEETEQEIELYKNSISVIQDEYPSVTLFGRTKAGKSTLFYGISDKGREFIGKGGQRASKITVASFYKGIRVLDTPGVDAAGKKGRSDEKKAKTIAEGSDFVVVILGESSDGIPPLIRKYIEKMYIEKREFIIVTNKKGVTIDNVQDLIKIREKNVFEEDYKVNLTVIPNVYADNSIKKMKVWIGAIRYYKSFKVFKAFTSNLKLFFMRNRIKKYSGMNYIVRHIYDWVVHEWRKQRISLFGCKKLSLYNNVKSLVEEKTRMYDELLLFYDNNKKKCISKINICQEEVNEAVKKHFEINFNKKYPDSVLYDSISKMNKKEYKEFILNLMTDIWTNEFQQSIQKIISDVELNMNSKISKEGIENSINNRYNEIKDVKLLPFYGKDIAKLTNYISNLTGILQLFIPSLTVASISLRYTSSIVDFFAKNSRKEKKEELLNNRVKEVKKILSDFINIIISYYEEEFDKAKQGIVNDSFNLSNKIIGEQNILKEMLIELGEMIE